MELNVSLHFSNLYKEINDILRCSSNTHQNTKTDFYKLRRSIFCSNLTALRISSQGNFFPQPKKSEDNNAFGCIPPAAVALSPACTPRNAYPPPAMQAPCHAPPFATHPHHACPSPCPHTPPAMHTLPVDRMTDTRFWNYYLAPKPRFAGGKKIPHFNS